MSEGRDGRKENATYSLSCSVVAHDKCERLVKLDDCGVVGAKRANALDEHLFGWLGEDEVISGQGMAVVIKGNGTREWCVVGIPYLCYSCLINVVLRAALASKKNMIVAFWTPMKSENGWIEGLVGGRVE